MSFFLLLALGAAAAAAWLLYQQLLKVEAELIELRKAVQGQVEPPPVAPPAGAAPEVADGAGAGGQSEGQRKLSANPLGFRRPAVSIPEHENPAGGSEPTMVQETVPRGGEIQRDNRDLPSGTSSRETSGENPPAETGSQPTEGGPSTQSPWADGSARPAEADAASAPALDQSAVKSLYSRWVRDQVRPADPPGWEVVPLRFVRAHQEHAAAVPVYLFEDAGHIGDFVRFSQAGDAEAYVLPHPDAAHNRDTFTLVFPEANPAVLDNTRSLVFLDPVRMRRNGQYWQAQ